MALDQRGHGESDKPESGYDFATVARDLRAALESRGLEKPLIVGHSWGADVALEFAVAYPHWPRGLGFVDGGMIEPSARPGMTLEQARVEMAPPDFTGMTIEQFRQRIRARTFPSPMPAEFEDIVLANFETLPDGTIQPRLSRANHLRIIDCPVGTSSPAALPAGALPDPAAAGPDAGR